MAIFNSKTVCLSGEINRSHEVGHPTQQGCVGHSNRTSPGFPEQPRRCFFMDRINTSCIQVHVLYSLYIYIYIYNIDIYILYIYGVNPYLFPVLDIICETLKVSHALNCINNVI